MMRAMKWWASVLACAWLGCVVLAGGCGDSGPPSRAHAVDDLAQSITAAFCSWQFRCCTGLEIAIVERGRYASEQDCAQATLTARDQLAVFSPAILEGTVTLDQGAASACVQQLRDRPCNIVPFPAVGEPIDRDPNVGAFLAACPGLLVGTLPKGLPCTLNAECARGLRCVAPGAAPSGGNGDGGPPVPVPAPGACEPYHQLGDECSSSADCDPAAGLYCRSTDFTCAAPAGESQPCVPGAFFGAPDVVVCDASMGLYCEPNLHVCRHLPRAGEPCLSVSAPSPCDPDPSLSLECVGTGFNGSGTCLAPGQPGDPCGGSALARCRTGLSCAATQPDGIGTCADAPALGEACGSDAVCGQGACDVATFRCSPLGPQPVGTSCHSNSECATLSCGGYGSTSSTCVAPVVPQCAGNQSTPPFVGPGPGAVDAGVPRDAAGFEVHESVGAGGAADAGVAVGSGPG
jgi:hypothetical protein